jgi:hypothetical protein
LKLKKAVLDKLAWNWKAGKGERTFVTLAIKDGILTVRKK